MKTYTCVLWMLAVMFCVLCFRLGWQAAEPQAIEVTSEVIEQPPSLQLLAGETFVVVGDGADRLVIVGNEDHLQKLLPTAVLSAATIANLSSDSEGHSIDD